MDDYFFNELKSHPFNSHRLGTSKLVLQSISPSINPLILCHWQSFWLRCPPITIKMSSNHLAVLFYLPVNRYHAAALFI